MRDDIVDVLLVENNPHDVEMTLRVLKNGDLASRVEVVRDGDEALDFLFCTGAWSHRRLSAGPRVVLLDLKMPLVSGLEVLRKLKSDIRTRCIPVVILTTSPEHNDIAECYRLGVNSYLVKPVDFDEFDQTMHAFGSYWLQLNQPPPSSETRG